MDLLALAAAPALAYLVIALLVAFDAIVPAVPSEIALVTAGTLAAAGQLHAGWAITAAAAGALAGDHAMHIVGQRALPGTLARSKLGRRIHKGVEHAYSGMGSASSVALIAGRFVPFGRTASATAAGLAGVPRATFLICSLTGGVLWACWMIGLGYTAGTAIDAPMWQQALLGAGVAIVVGVWVAAIRAVIRTRRRMSARALSTTADIQTAPPVSADLGTTPPVGADLGTTPPVGADLGTAAPATAGVGTAAPATAGVGTAAPATAGVGATVSTGGRPKIGGHTETTNAVMYPRPAPATPP